MAKELSFETLDLLAELDEGRRNAKPIALIARHLDVTKKKVVKMIDRARDELEESSTLIMNNGHGAYYKREVDDGDAEQQEIQSLLQLFRA